MIIFLFLCCFLVNKHKPWIETSYHGVITENNDTVILDPPLVALDKDAPVPFAGRMAGILICSGRTHSGCLMPNLYEAELGPKSYCHHPMFRWPVIFMLCVSSPCQCGLFISLWLFSLTLLPREDTCSLLCVFAFAVLVFFETESLYLTDYPGTRYVDQAGHDLTEINLTLPLSSKYYDWRLVLHACFCSSKRW